MRGIFFEEDHARSAASRLRRDGWAAAIERERLAGEDDDEDHPWAVVTDAPLVVLDALVDQFEGWLDDQAPEPAPPPVLPPSRLPTAPRRTHHGLDGTGAGPQ